MKTRYILITYFLFMLCWSARGRAQSLNVFPVAEPEVVRGGGKQQVVWELILQNATDRDINITKITVLTASGETFAEYAGRKLGDLIANLPERTSTPRIPNQRIRAGEFAIAFFLVEKSDLASIPAMLTERFDVAGPRGSERIDGPLTAVNIDPPAIVSAPLRGGPWVAFNGLANDSIHRRAVYAFENGVFDAQRFAIDFVKIDEQGNMLSGDPASNDSYYAYRQEVLAVADGVVASTQDGAADNAPGIEPPFSPDTAAGNNIIIDMGGGRYAVYCHLLPGSLRVSSGDRVTKGTVLARVGNSGNSSAPHLHFHVCDANATLACNGLPYVFDQFRTEDGQKRLELPMKDEIVVLDN